MNNYDLVAPDESQPVRILSRLVDDALHHRQGTFGRAAKFFRLQSRSEVVWYLECPPKKRRKYEIARQIVCFVMFCFVS